jgi:hypothetical protein
MVQPLLADDGLVGQVGKTGDTFLVMDGTSKRMSNAAAPSSSEIHNSR